MAGYTNNVTGENKSRRLLWHFDIELTWKKA